MHIWQQPLPSACHLCDYHEHVHWSQNDEMASFVRVHCQAVRLLPLVALTELLLFSLTAGRCCGREGKSPGRRRCAPCRSLQRRSNRKDL